MTVTWLSQSTLRLRGIEGATAPWREPKRKHRMKLSWQQVTLPALVLGLVSVAVPGRAQAQAAIKIDGSSTVFPISEAYAEEFQIQKRGKVRVTVGISGTGGGFKKFCRGETDVQDASRPILAAEMEACRAAGVKYYELPIAYDALTVVVNKQN